MARIRQFSPAVRALGAVFLVIVVLLLVGLFFVSYRAMLALAGGIVAAFLVAWLISRSRGVSRRVWVGLGLLAVLAVVVGVLLASRRLGVATFAPEDAPAGSEGGEGEAVAKARVTAYQLEVFPGEVYAAGVRVEESLVLEIITNGVTVESGVLVEFPARFVPSARRGFLLREVSIVPLELGPYQPVPITLPDGTPIEVTLCAFTRCPADAPVRLTDWPVNGFYAARGVPQVERQPYVNTEIVIWQHKNFSESIVFSYILKPFNTFYAVLSPLVGASNASEWIVGLIGLLGTLLAMPIIGGLLQGLVEDALTNWLKNLFGKKRSSRRTRR
jgi:hypothetical protein